MRPDAPRHRPASIHRRLLNGARERGEDPQFAVQRYAAERFLYRLGVSSHRDAFVLKGAMLFAIWGGSAYRPTRDLDFGVTETRTMQRSGTASATSVRSRFPTTA